MLIRIVRMEFRPETLPDFLALFERTKAHIAAFPGCKALALHSDAGNPNVRYTHSQWESPEALENYRHSELFRSTWAQTKPLFAAQPMAFSLV